MVMESDKKKLKKRFVSPTDELSPCSRKLQVYRARRAVSKSEPHKLRFSAEEKE